MSVATMDRVGRLVLPQKIRDQLHLKEGTRFRVAVVADRIQLEPELEEAGLIEKDGVLIANFKGPPMDIRAAIKADRQARIDRVGRHRPRK